VKLERKWLGLLYPLLDLLAAEIAFFTAVILRYGSFYPIPPFFAPLSYLFYAVLIIALYLPVLWAFRTGRDRVPSVLGLFKSVFVLSVLVNILPFYFRDYAFSRIVFLSFCVLAFFYGLLWRFVFHLVIDTAWGTLLIRERVLLAARAGHLADLAESLENTSAGRFEIVALACEREAEIEESWVVESKAVGNLDQVPQLASDYAVDVVFLDPEGINPRRWLGLAETLAADGIGMRLLSGLELETPLVIDSSPIAPAETVDLLAGPIEGFQALIKRSMDILISLLLLIASSPLIVAIILAIKASSKGPVLYRQERVGKHGIVFSVYKLRTMVHEAERDTGPVWSSGDDRRIIPGIGHFLRRTGLDELPQFWNVLTGKMSLVGPRPERAYFFESYPELYRGRLAVRPGLTGLAQVSCRDTTSVHQKVRYDLYYIRNYSLGLDIEILWTTSVMLVLQEANALFRRTGKSEPDRQATIEQEQENGPEA
jgi:exopolysaccharide biosynthesis polyprenyl glycosylphosphotransferase